MLRSHIHDNATLFIGGILDGRHIDVCQWQRVHYVIKGGLPVARYVRRHLSFGKGPAVRVFTWDRLGELEALRRLPASVWPGTN